MAEVMPFRGLLYNREKVKEFGLVITPPYDVISDEQKASYAKKSPYNFVNLILPESYDNAAEMLNEMQSKEILKQDDKECIYAYEQEYTAGGKKYQRTGFIALLKLEEFGEGILPHEKTLDKPVDDRLRLLEAVKANLEIIFLVYEDEKKLIDRKIKKGAKELYIDFSDGNVTHKLFRISDSELIELIRKEMQKHQCVIADGHHRYKTSLHYSKKHGYNYVMACFVNSFNEGLVILPTNRLIFGVEHFNINNLINEMGNYFEVEKIDSLKEIKKRLEASQNSNKKNKTKENVFGFYDNTSKKSYFLRLKDKGLADGFFEGKSEAYNSLDVSILHKIIIERILGLDGARQEDGMNIEFVKGMEETLKKLNDKKYQLAFFLNPPLIEDVFLTARAHETMPQKSTYFYPKIYSGLVINKISEVV